MPQNAARNGVYCISSSVTITTSGMNRCQDVRSTSASDGISDAGHAAEFEPLGLQVHHVQDGEVVQRRRDDRHQDQLVVRNAQRLGHDERGRAHDRRRDLAAARRRRLDGAGKTRREADLLHQRNRHDAGGHGVGDRRAGDHAEQARRHHADLGRPARKAPGRDRRQVDEQLAQPGELRHDAEQHEVKDEGGHHADRYAVDAFGALVQVRHDTRHAVAAMAQAAGQVRAEDAVEHGDDGQQRQEDAHGAARRLDHHGDGDHAHHQVDRCVFARALDEDLWKIDQQVQARNPRPARRRSSRAAESGYGCHRRP